MKKLFLFIFMALTVTVSMQTVAQSDRAVQANNASCGPNLRIKITNPSDNVTVQGSQNLSAQLEPRYENLYVFFVIDGTPLGRAEHKGSGLYSFEWDSRSVDNGRHQLVARVATSESLNRFCQSAPQKVKVDNQTASQESVRNSQPTYSELRSEIKPTRWSAPTNVSKNFEVRTQAKVSGENGFRDVSDQAVYRWKTSIGTISSEGSKVRVFSGPRSGQGSLQAEVHFQGMTTTVEVDIYVNESSANSARKYPESVASNEVGGTNDIASETDNPDQTSDDISDEAQDVSAIPGDTELRDCLVSTLGEERYQSLVTQTNRLRFSELRTASSCFADTRNVVPVNLSAVAPEEIRNQAPVESDGLKIEKLENNLDVLGGDQGTKLVLSGVSEPNQTVLIYIFSEPLVLVTSAGDDGRWQYELTDPLEPGEHEAFIAVESDDGAVQRSESLLFNVAFAEGTEDNPAGFSLNLQDEQPQQEQNFWIVAVGSAVIGLSVLTFVIYKFVIKNNQSSAPPANAV